MDWSVTLPSSSRYMSCVAASGAFSRWSSAWMLPSARRTIMKPPPPKLPASGLTTASASPVAIAASTALPPAARMSSPTRVANSSVVETIPPLAVAGGVAGWKGHPSGKVPPDCVKSLAGAGGSQPGRASRRMAGAAPRRGVVRLRIRWRRGISDSEAQVDGVRCRLKRVDTKRRHDNRLP